MIGFALDVALGEGFLGASQLADAALKEDQRCDARRGDHEDRDFAEGVPCAGVDECDVDDVLAETDLVGCVPPSFRDGVVDAGSDGDECDERRHRADGAGQQSAPPARRAEGAVGEVAGELTDHQDEDDEGDGLHQHLCEGQIRGTPGEEDCGQAVASDGDQQDAADATA